MAFSEIVRLLPKDSGAWINLGVCCVVLGDFPAATEAFERAIALEPYNAATYTNLAPTWISRGQPEVAVSVLEKGLRFIENNPTLLATKGAVLAQMDEIPSAIHLLSQAYALAPTDFSIALIFSELLVGQQRFSEALSILNTKQWPKDRFLPRYYLALARAFYGCHDVVAARTAMVNAQNAGAAEAEELLTQLERGWGASIASKRIVMEPLRARHAPYVFELQEDLDAWRYYNPHGILASSAASVEQEILKRYEYPLLPPKELAWVVFHRRGGAQDYIGLCQLVDLDHQNKRAEVLMIMKGHGKGYGVEAILIRHSAPHVA